MNPIHDHSGKLTRRQAVGLAGATGAALVAARVGAPRRLLGPTGADEARAATAACVLTPAKEEGPFFVDEKLFRSDVRADPGDGSVQAGVPLTLTFVVEQADGDCTPVSGATIDIWNANAQGVYSDEAQECTSGEKWLRGAQVTDDEGMARFVTNFPGWYSGRAVHVHATIRLFDGSTTTYEFTTQLFFDPAITSAVIETSAYSSHGSPDTSNASDRVYGSDDASVLVPLAPDGSSGYTGRFTVGLTGLPSSTSGSTGTGLDSTGTGSGSTGSGSTGSGSTGAAAVLAGLRGTSFRRTSSGKRVLEIGMEADEKVTVTALLTRGRTTVARRKKRFKPGTRTLELPMPRSATGGSARLTVTMKDASGATKVKRRRHDPKAPMRRLKALAQERAAH